MAPLHRCVHIHSCLGRLHQFSEYYAQNRRQQVGLCWAGGWWLVLGRDGMGWAGIGWLLLHAWLWLVLVLTALIGKVRGSLDLLT